MAIFLINTGKIVIFPEKDVQEIHNDENTEISLNNFWQAYNLIKQNYYAYPQLKKEELENGMIRGIVESLDDKHSEFMDSTEKKQFEDMLTGDFEWIGANVEKHPLGVLVENVISGSPAKKYWVKAKDIIIKANGEELKDKNLYDAVDKIKWPAGSKVILTILREGEKDLLDIEVIREKITIPSVESKVLDDTLWYIVINLFWDNTSAEFKKSLKELQSKNITGLIIDLRDNGGGYLQSAVEILSEFTKGWDLLVETRYREAGDNTSYYSQNEGVIFDKKVVVLVNENSASASEITAWALRDYGIAIVVGEKTYGKWSVQEPFDLPNGGLMKLTIAHWFTPKWKTIEKEGITPDVEVKYEKEDYEKKYDRQLEEAKKVLKEFIKTDVLQLSIDTYKKTVTPAKK